MNEEPKSQKFESSESAPTNSKKPKVDYFLPASILISAIVLAGTWVYTIDLKYQQSKIPAQLGTNNPAAVSSLQEKVTPAEGVALPVHWGNLGTQMVRMGVIDEPRFEALYASRGGLSTDIKAMLNGSSNGQITIDAENSGVILNLLWALGLGNRNPILENGPMQDQQYGGAGRFASTDGWTLAKGSAMNHYDAHQFVILTADQQALVEAVAKNIYRPCCGNSTYFPDCNHGMAMLGLLELMASQGVSESEIYKTALAVNSYWFPDTYRMIARYFENKGVQWSVANPKEILGSAYSSAQGYARIQTLIVPESPTQSQDGCGVDAGQPNQSQRQQGGCGV